MIALLFVSAVAVYALAELEYHPQAVLHYLEMEDREMARKVRSIINVRGLPSGKPSFRPSFKPSGNPVPVVSTQYLKTKRNALCAWKYYALTYSQ